MDEPDPIAPEPPAVERRGVTRRGVIATAAGGLIASTVVALSGWTPQPRPILAPGGMARRTPLPIPPLAEPEIAADGTRVFSLNAQVGQSGIVPAGMTTSWGYNGSFAGPTLHAYEGERIRVVVRNELPRDDDRALAWHEAPRTGRRRPSPADCTQ